jgi:hypothetical protein
MEESKTWLVTHNADDTFTIRSAASGARSYQAINLSADDAGGVLRDLIALMHARGSSADSEDGAPTEREPMIINTVDLSCPPF